MEYKSTNRKQWEVFYSKVFCTLPYTFINTPFFVFLLIYKEYSILLTLSHTFLYNRLIVLCYVVLFRHFQTDRSIPFPVHKEDWHRDVIQPTLVWLSKNYAESIVLLFTILLSASILASKRYTSNWPISVRMTIGP